MSILDFHLKKQKIPPPYSNGFKMTISLFLIVPVMVKWSMAKACGPSHDWKLGLIWLAKWVKKLVLWAKVTHGKILIG